MEVINRQTFLFNLYSLCLSFNINYIKKRKLTVIVLVEIQYHFHILKVLDSHQNYDNAI
jgi:hypothetical protein